MTHINVKISKAVATAEKDGIITAGMVGVPVSFMFDSWWDGLMVTAVFKGSGAPISVPLLGATETVVPWEVLKRPSTLLRIGAEGRLPDGTLVIPTTWATVDIVMSGANATDDLAKPPTPTAFDLIMSQIGNMNDLATEDKSSLVAAINEALTQGGGEVDPEAVQKIVEDYLAANPPTVTETDPTVPAWAKQPTKPTYTAAEVGALPDTYTPPNQTAQQVGADPAGTAASAVSQHNTDTTAHNDLRLALQELANRINAALDSDDTTLDQLGEVVAYIKSNRSLIEAITTSKVSVADIVNDLVTNVTDKPLSAAQGVVIKTLIDALRNDKLDAAELTNAVNTALAQAKASGEFDGADGKSAYQYAVEGGYTGTEAEFAEKLAQEIPTVDGTLTQSGQAADAAEVGSRLSSLSEEIVTASESKVAAHNTGTDTHSDIRLLIQGLTDRLNALADSDDTTLDQLSEVVAYIKSNRTLIEAITTDKVSVSDVIDNLTSNVSNKPLSAAQGVALKGLIDAISIPDKLPNPNALTFTGAVTGSYDGSAAKMVNIPSAVTDDHINELINAALNAIGVAEGVSY